MKKVLLFTAFALLLVVCAVSPVRAQASKVRVGPAADDFMPYSGASSVRGDEKKVAPPASAKQAAPDGVADRGKDATESKDTKAAPRADKGDQKDVVEKSVSISTAAASAPIEGNSPTSVTDAPPKGTVLPVVLPNAEVSKDKASTPASSATTPAPAPSSSKNDAPVAVGDTKATPPAASGNSMQPASDASADAPTANVAPANAVVTSTVEAPSAAASPSSAEPAAAPALTAIYRVGAGDVLDVRLLNLSTTRESTLFTVMSGGVLEYPLAGEPLGVAGMTTEEIGARIASELKRRAVYTNPRVSVNVREYASHAVMVNGLVGSPGTKILRREAMPLYVVVAEAQPLPEAARAVVMSRATGQTTVVDLLDGAAMNVLVQSGDVVQVQTRPKEFFYIGGQVNAPGQKDYHDGLTLTQAVLASGGTTRAAGIRVRVSRQSADGLLTSTEFNLKEIEDGKAPDPRLRPGDRVEVSRGKNF